MPPTPFERQDADRKPDEALRSEARAHLAATPHLRLVAELARRDATTSSGKRKRHGKG
jgi:hypothetical protein